MQPEAATPAPAGDRGHINALDAVRGLAILLVLAHSFNILEGQTLAAHALELGLDFGWVGVQLFFVLSGFLITGILLDTQNAPNYYVSFFGRRVLRIFPLYYGALFVAFVIVPLCIPPQGAWLEEQRHQVWLWTYLANWVEPYGLSVRSFSHFWSLAVEEQFYLIWPFLVRRLSAPQVFKLSLWLMVAAFGIRTAMVFWGANPEAMYTFTICRMDALAAGAAGAAALRVPEVYAALRASFRKLLIASALLFAVGAVVTHGYHRTIPVTQTIGYSILAAVFGILVTATACGEARSRIWVALVNSRALMSAGRYSYAMYVFGRLLHTLWGLPLLARIAPHASLSAVQGLAYVIVLTLITYGLAFISYHAFEKRFLQLKRFFKAERPAAAAASETNNARA